MVQTVTVQANNSKRRAILVDSISSILVTAKTTSDSIPILYDLFDLSVGSQRLAVGEMLLRTALRTSDYELQCDVLRRYSSAVAGLPTNQSQEMNKLIETASGLPEGTDRSNTITYMRAQQVMNEFNAVADSVRQNKVHKAIRDRAAGVEDQYENVVLLFTLCRYMVGSSPGDMVIDYLGQLYRQIRALPERSYALENMFLVQASIIYTNAELHEQAVKMCKELLKVVADLDRSNAKNGHRYRDYSRVNYSTYRRLLNNFEALTPEEIEDYYQKIQQLAAEDTQIARDVDLTGRVEIYYAMGTKQYARALALLKKYIDLPQNEPHLNSLYRFMLKAATEVGDEDAQLVASRNLNEILGKALEERRLERKRELEVINEMLVLQNEQALAAQELADMHAQHHSNLMLYGSIAIAAMAIAIIIMFLLYRRIRQMSNKLSASNRLLVAERDNLQQTQRELITARDHARKADRHKTEFINNMSHEVRVPLDTLVECAHLIVDNVDEAKKKYLERYAKIVNVCAGMLSALVNDVLLLAEFDNSAVEINKKPESANTICELAIMSMRKQCKDGVTMEFVGGDVDDVTIDTDARRVEQVLVNLLSNGAKFTDSGKVELSYFIVPETNMMTFVVTDTGCGIPQGKEEVIFERFEKLSSMTPGTGIGLNICRLVARALGGDVTVDTTYEGPGARMLFTIPINNH